MTLKSLVPHPRKLCMKIICIYSEICISLPVRLWKPSWLGLPRSRIARFGLGAVLTRKKRLHKMERPRDGRVCNPRLIHNGLRNCQGRCPASEETRKMLESFRGFCLKRKISFLMPCPITPGRTGNWVISWAYVQGSRRKKYLITDRELNYAKDSMLPCRIMELVKKEPSQSLTFEFVLHTLAAYLTAPGPWSILPYAEIHKLL